MNPTIKAGKDKLRRALAAMPIAEKLRLVEHLAARQVLLRSAVHITQLPLRIAAKIIPSHDLDSLCWIWIGAESGNGYGKVSIEGKMKMAHRAVYEIFLGPIPPGFVLDHLCRNRGCCNPHHMEPVTVRENTLRGNAVLFPTQERP
jgi:hypothetical protein